MVLQAIWNLQKKKFMMPPRWLSWRHRQKASYVPVSQKARAMDIAAGTNLKNESEMKKYFFYLSTLALLAAACNKIDNNSTPIEEEPAPAVQMITETVSGSRGTSTKATIADADASFAWTAGDNVAVHISNGKYVYTSDEGASGATPKPAPDADVATFKVVYEAGYERDAFAVYPSTIVDEDATNYGQSGHTLDVTLPDSYTLAKVQGEVSPCPMIATNAAGAGWDFFQLCGLLRLTVNDIPATAKRLEIDFNGKKVCGDFSIASPVTPGSSVITTEDDAANDCITITKDGTNVALGSTSLVLNIPLPTGAYKKITVLAYDALTGGNALEGMTVQFDYTADNSHATKKATALGPLQSIFNFTFKNSGTELKNVRFARVFSVQNKLHNGTSTYGPFTASADTNLASPVNTALHFDQNPGDQLAFQVITGDGKVYSGLVDTPAGGYDIGETYNVTADVNLFTFTVSSGKKVYFSPGDLGVNNGVYSFTEPFAQWGGEGAEDAAIRVYFEGSEARPDKELYGVTWRLQTWPNPTDNKNEWENLIARTMNAGVNPYYKVQVGSYKYCVLLPPDETIASDIGDDLTTQVTDYVKYIAKGFVILMNTNYKSTAWSTSDRGKQGGYYWTNRPASPADRTLFYWTNTDNPTTINASSAYHCLHVRYVRDVE